MSQGGIIYLDVGGDIACEHITFRLERRLSIYRARRAPNRPSMNACGTTDNNEIADLFVDRGAAETLAGGKTRSLPIKPSRVNCMKDQNAICVYINYSLALSSSSAITAFTSFNGNS